MGVSVSCSYFFLGERDLCDIRRRNGNLIETEVELHEWLTINVSDYL